MVISILSDEDILKLYFLCFILSGLRIYFYLVMIQPCYDGSFLICFISFPLFFCFLIWFWIYSLRPHQVLIQGCTFLQPVVIINNRYFFFFWLFFILWSLKIRSWKIMAKIIKFLFFYHFFAAHQRICWLFQQSTADWYEEQYESVL